MGINHSYFDKKPGIEKNTFGLSLKTGILTINTDSSVMNKKIKLGFFDIQDEVNFLVRLNGNIVIQKNGDFLYEIVDINPNSSNYFSAYLHGMHSKISVKMEDLNRCDNTTFEPASGHILKQF